MHSLSFTNGQFIIGENKYVFEQVLSHFPSSTFIGVMTYNIAGEKSTNILLEKLKSACDVGAHVTFITNIPGRFESYTSTYAKQKAKSKIDHYIHSLDPVKYGQALSVYFNFQNHAKVIVTDEILYWGSANFSDASKSNIECGTISTDPNLINYIKNTYFPEIISRSIPYNKYDIITAVYNLRNVIESCNRFVQMILESSFYSQSNCDDNNWTYDYDNNSLTIADFQQFLDDVQQHYEVANKDIQDIISTRDLKGTELHLLYGEQDKIFDSLIDHIHTFMRTAKDLLGFDEDKETFSILYEDYPIAPCSNNPDYYMEKAQVEAHEKHLELIWNAEANIKSLLQALREIIDHFTQITEWIYALCDVNPIIDNTHIEEDY